MVIEKEKIAAIDFGGLRIFDYTAGRKEKSSFAVINVPVNVSHQLSWSKRSDKYYYVLEGRIDFWINDEKHTLKKGDFCIIRKGEKFKYANPFSEDASVILFHTPSFVLEKEVFV